MPGSRQGLAERQHHVPHGRMRLGGRLRESPQDKRRGLGKDVVKAAGRPASYSISQIEQRRLPYHAFANIYVSGHEHGLVEVAL